MVRYHNFDVVFAEIPGETTLALNITGCPNRCPGCHSPHLQADEGRVLDEAELLGLLARYGRSVTCVAFMQEYYKDLSLSAFSSLENYYCRSEK